MKIKESKKLQNLKDITKTHCRHGNWNYDSYMHGLANGLILAIATLENKDPKYLEAPELWIADKPTIKTKNK